MSERKIGDASKVQIAGGDDSNYYMFYVSNYSSSYDGNSLENIAAFAQEKFDSCAGKSVEEISAKHIFWGTDSSEFRAFYNGDTYILFDDIRKLPKNIREDAMNHCKGYKE